MNNITYTKTLKTQERPIFDILGFTSERVSFNQIAKKTLAMADNGKLVVFNMGEGKYLVCAKASEQAKFSRVLGGQNIKAIVNIILDTRNSTMGY